LVSRRRGLVKRRTQIKNEIAAVLHRNLKGRPPMTDAILPLDAGSKADTFFLVALGFLAGFSERFAQDMFVRSGQGLAGPGGDSPSSGLSAGLVPPPGGRPNARTAAA
jgi:hypothetical protein